MAGVVLRLEGLSVEGELRGLHPKHAALLSRAVDAIFHPFETGRPQLDGHYIGALYVQAVVPWLCAWRGGGKTDALAANVRRAGRAICRWLEQAPRGAKSDLRRRVCERLHQEYAALACSSVWGGQDSDPVWKAFFA
jgi:hypothetical protein